MKTQKFDDGIVICGSFPDPEVVEAISAYESKFPLILLDPPYGGIVKEDWDEAKVQAEDAQRFLDLARAAADRALDGGALYFFGGYGKPLHRPFFEFLSRVEQETPWRMTNYLTWAKKRAYGTSWNYLATREELAYFILGDPKQPRCFEIPLLDTKRGYPGYNKKYPAKSEYLRRTSVWTDIPELFKGKKHPTEKPVALLEVPIAVHTKPGEAILDPMAGSGVSGEAARKLGRRFVLVEKEPEYYEKIIARLR